MTEKKEFVSVLIDADIESPAHILIMREWQMPNHIKKGLSFIIDNHCNLVNGIIEEGIHQKSTGNWKSRAGEYRECVIVHDKQPID